MNKILFKYIATFLAIFLLIANVYAIDKRYLDSVEDVYNTSKNKKVQLYALYILAFEHGLFNPKKGIELSKKLLVEASKEKDSTMIFRAYNGIANSYETMMIYDSSLYYNELCYEIVKHSKKNNMIYASLSNLSLDHKKLGHYNLALQYLEKASKSATAKGEHNPRYYYYLCDLYLRINNLEKAKNIILTGLVDCEQRTEQVDYFKNILYGYLGICYAKLSKPDSAFILLNTSMQGLKKETDTIALANSVEFMADAQLQYAKYDSAIYYYNKAIKLYENLNNKALQNFVNIKLIYALSYMKANNMVQLQNQLLNATQNIQNYNTNYDLLLDTYTWLNKTYERLDDFKNALRFSKKTDSLTQAILNNEKRLMFLDFEKSYETLEREKKIEQLKNTNKINQLELDNKNAALKQYVLLIVLIVLVFFSVTFSLFQYNKKKRAIMSAAHQLNVQETKQKERIRISKDIHDEIGSGLSKISLTTELSKKKLTNDIEVVKTIESIGSTSKQLIENMRDLIWTLKPENATLDQLAAHLREYAIDYLENFPIAPSLNFQENIPPQINLSIDVQHNILLVFKEAINNVVKHSEASTITISFHFSNAYLRLIIEDNGRGFDVNTLNKNGNGLNNMQQRIQAIGGTYNIQSQLEKGTRINIDCKIV